MAIALFPCRHLTCRIMLHYAQRRIAALFTAMLMAGPATGQQQLPVGSHPEPVATPHFPDRLHAVVWRNWRLVEPARIAETLGTSVENIRRLADSMGLPPVEHVNPQWRRRGYITLVRRNWHLLPYEQILQLVDMSADEFAVALREDDFLFIKLGSLKPECEPVRWREPDERARQRAAEIRRHVDEHFGKALSQPITPAFQFVEELSGASRSDPAAGEATAAGDEPPPRFLYSYFGTFGDPLSDPRLDPYPDGLLQRLADQGVNGVWLHVVLRQIAPGGAEFPEFGDGHQRRLKNLRKLVARAKRYGISIYLYINEPRAMPAEFFADRPQIAGVAEGDWRAMCTSNPRVRAWLEDSLTHVFTEVPDLGGVFTITGSENLTHCASHGNHDACPHCRQRSDAEIIAEVNSSIETGVHRGNANAKVIVWDWGWRGHGDASELISQLPKNVWFMSVSEWAKPIERGGVTATVGEYSMSVVGPGPRARRHWKVAKQAGLKTVAKMQISNTWELSAVPYLPVMDLVARHCSNLAQHDVDGAMLSWSLGGYPSPNLRIAQQFAEQPAATVDGVLDRLAADLYGPAGATEAREAWTAFSDAFQEFPYHGKVLYTGPQQVGPANLLHAEPTGFRATMVGFPYDDLDSWRGLYPREIFADQMEKVATGWARGVDRLRQAAAAAPESQQAFAAGDVRVAEAAHLHFASVANQAEFVQARDALLKMDRETAARKETSNRIHHLIDEEIHLAKRLLKVRAADSRIGFEASNHYYYTPLDLVEKVISCEYLRSQKFAGKNSR